MILQALHEYFTRKQEAGALPPYGFARRRIDFLIVLDESGKYRSLECLHDKKGARVEGRAMTVPAIGTQALKHDNSGKDANLLWDRAAFVLGVGKHGRSKLDAFIRTLEDYFEPSPPQDIQAILSFLKAGRNDRSLFAPITGHPDYGELIRTGAPILSFRIEGTEEPVFSRSFVERVLHRNDKNGPRATCLVTGNRNAAIALTHPVVKGVAGTKSSGAALISFNKDPFESYGWRQGQNAPVSTEAATAYVKALGHLCASELNTIKVADTTTVFWQETEAGASYDLEANFSPLFADQPGDDPDRGVLAVKALYEAVRSGAIPVDEGNRFHVLGLAPNVARIAVRFWKTGTIKDFADKIKQHFDDMEIVRSPKDREHLTLNQILRATARDYKTEHVPPNLAGAVVESILEGTPYPVTLLHQCIRRLRTEHKVTRARAAIFKACVNRSGRQLKPHKQEELTVSLDRTNTSAGYRLGRLFAVLEKIQEEAMPGINATIRDRLYGAASSSPVTVFPQLLRLKNHHLSKLVNRGRRVNFEKMLGEVLEGLQDFPPHLAIEDQARFAVGYYHERQSFFRGKTDKIKRKGATHGGSNQEQT